MMNIILAAIVGIALGSAIVAFITKANVNKVRTESETTLKNTLDERERQYQQMKDSAERSHEQIVEGLKSNLSSIKEDYEKRLREQKDDYTKELQEQRDEYKQSLADQEARNNAQNEEMKKSLADSVVATTERVINQRREQLEQKNKESLGQIINPLKDEIDRMQKAFNENKEKYAESNSKFIGAIENMIKQTDTMTISANNLATALVSKGKVQGNWGEHVLADILRDSGLREGTEFTQQESFKGAKNNTLIADVVVNMPDNARIIIDSKVSITAYTEYVSAQTAEEQEDAKKRNYTSVVQHINELADKEYHKYVDGAIEKVLMFIPNEGSYVLAVNHDNGLVRYAYNKGVVLVNPTTLMLTLELIARTWQNTRQEDNCLAIVKAACTAYDKLMGVVETFRKVETSLDKTRRDFDEGMGQLCDGKFNLKRQFEGLKDMGVTSNKIAKPKSNSKNQTAENQPAEIPEGF